MGLPLGKLCSSAAAPAAGPREQPAPGPAVRPHGDALIAVTAPVLALRLLGSLLCCHLITVKSRQFTLLV